MDQTPIADMKFETAVAELEASIAAYKRGMELMQHCQAQLANAEEEIRIIENGETRLVDRKTLEAS